MMEVTDIVERAAGFGFPQCPCGGTRVQVFFFSVIGGSRRDGGLGEERSGWVGDGMMELWCREDYRASSRKF